jgi:acetylornithine/succinyldiaminopimelate/putrescine aminotransferase
MPYPGYVELAEKLNQLTPGRFPKKTALFSTGAEAIENSVKIGRAATGRPGIKGRPYKGKDELVERKILTQSVYNKIKDQVIAKQAQ